MVCLALFLPTIQVVLVWILFTSLAQTRKERFFLPEPVELPGAGVPGGYEIFDHASENFVWVYSNITNIYEKVQVLRKTVGDKCSKTRCDKTLTKVKKFKFEMEVMQANTNSSLLSLMSDVNILKTATNVTLLEEVLQLVKNSSTLDVLAELQQTTITQKNAIDTLTVKTSSLESTVESQSAKISTLESSASVQKETR